MQLRKSIIFTIILVVSITAGSAAVAAQSTGSTAVQTASVTTTVTINDTVGSDGTERFRAIEVTSDDGFVAAGEIGGGGDTEMWVVKFDSQGSVVWNRTYDLGTGDGAFSDSASAEDVIETDSGYVIAGSGPDGSALLKVDDQGAKQWDNGYGGTGFKSVIEASNGDLVAVGTANSPQDDTQGYLVRADSQGTEQWNETYGEIDQNKDDFNFMTDEPEDLVQSGDGGFVFAGTTDRSGNDDVWALKTDGQGQKQWNATVGGFSTEQASGVVGTDNGGYVIVANRQPNLLGVKLDAAGNTQWEKEYSPQPPEGSSDSGDHGGSTSFTAEDVIRNDDGDYVLLGDNRFGDLDAGVATIDGNGMEQWNTTFPGAEVTLRDIEQTSDGDYVLGGYTEEYTDGIDKDGLLVKLGFAEDGSGDDGTDGNEPPTVAVSADPTTAEEGESIEFDCSESTDEDGQITNHEWDFGDASTGQGESTTHSYASAGTYEVTCTVTDDDGATSSGTVTVTVESASDGDEGLSATRDIASTTVPAGESTEVSVTIQAAATTSDLRFRDTYDSSLSATVLDDDGATISAAASTEVTASWGGVSEATITYEVTVPGNASDGDTFELSGTVEDKDAGSQASIGGDTTIEVGEPSNPAAQYANDQGVVDSTGLLDAAADFRSGELDSSGLLDVAAAFRSGNPVL